MKATIIAGCIALVACHRDRERPPAPAPPPAARAPIRGAAGDSDLRELLAEVASAKACELIRGQFRGLRAPDRPGVVTGVLWIRDCSITHDGTRVTYSIAGNGWQWADQTKHQAGGTFVVREYVKFGVHATLHGALDLGYDRASHVLSFWYTPAQPPEIEFEPVGKVTVDRKGLWSSVLGALSAAFADSPEAQGKHQAEQQGTQQFEQQLADGLTVAIDLCTGYQRFSLGRPRKGSLGPADVGETARVPVELQPGAVFVFGPELAPRGMTIDVDASGPVRVDLACAERAEQLAGGFVHGTPPPAIATLAEAIVNGHRRIHAAPARCKVAVVARSVVAVPVTLSWRRPPGERARATGGPVVRCAR